MRTRRQEPRWQERPALASFRSFPLPMLVARPSNSLLNHDIQQLTHPRRLQRDRILPFFASSRLCDNLTETGYADSASGKKDFEGRP